ncbi:MAG: PDZ domain-containing protein, partial [Allorhizobium sp.]
MPPLRFTVALPRAGTQFGLRLDIGSDALNQPAVVVGDVLPRSPAARAQPAILVGDVLRAVSGQAVDARAADAPRALAGAVARLRASSDGVLLLL